ncbi:D-tyrosyl-tRNA(Tyr) deacylase [Desulfuromonas soudanensis]|uniref:D-aminoacyl-tRNA deacylase n=1 Tax=Desulfuromonas soudanensis TaxID=1603606 RepID=A0A0M3QGF3_9BACT|nr:D-aminoacyl-tRNA deacylase [Desulfuromonas soudanensis]ALC17879.1 D-tyrosyl-tRNA(Tyr) deacylase [Desulfuromonas soudanensis]
MRAVLQRVSSASVTVEGTITGAIGPGLMILLGVEKGDGEEDASFLAKKTAGLRIFEDGEGRMNLAVGEAGGAVLVVSQFTLLADCRKGRRPGFSQAAPPQEADALYRRFVELLRQEGLEVATGVFQATMDVQLINNGPVTMLLDSRKDF